MFPQFSHYAYFLIFEGEPCSLVSFVNDTKTTTFHRKRRVILKSQLCLKVENGKPALHQVPQVFTLILILLKLLFFIKLLYDFNIILLFCRQYKKVSKKVKHFFQI